MPKQNASTSPFTPSQVYRMYMRGKSILEIGELCRGHGSDLWGLLQAETKLRHYLQARDKRGRRKKREENS